MKKTCRRMTAVLLSVMLACSAFVAMSTDVFAAETDSAVASDVGTTGECVWLLDDNGVLTISGNGKMDDYSYVNVAPWGKQIKRVVIEDGVTDIGSFAFCDCKGLTEISIPDSVTGIGIYAFKDCTELSSVTIPNSVTQIDGYAFFECKKLSNVVLGNSLNSIGENAFGFCTALTNVTIPDSVTKLDKGAFYYCTGLTGVIVPDSVTSIGVDAFCGCTGLTDLTIGYSVTSIGGLAFSGCGNLKQLTIPESVTSIGMRALGYYYGYKKIENFTICGEKGSAAEDYAVNNGFIFIEGMEPLVLFGDLNGDGIVNGADAGLLSRYVSGWKDYETKIKNMAAADISRDGQVNGADAGILSRYVSGWTQFAKYFE